jgi:hypothetical protein
MIGVCVSTTAFLLLGGTFQDPTRAKESARLTPR